MKVELIAHTLIHSYYSEDYTTERLVGMEVDNTTLECDALAEFAGRACYQSFNKPNEATRANKDYLANIIAQQHFSVLEHASATFYITGVSRSLTHELVRHRHLSYSQLSQRFVNEETAGLVYPPAVEGNDEAMAILEAAFVGSVSAYRDLAARLGEAGLTRKQVREAARSVLANATETKIVVTGNMRAWRDFLSKRLSPAADAEIRGLAQEILGQLRNIAPHSFQDFEDG